MNHYGIIMAGGGGTRFWPLSRLKTPKQLLNLSGKDYMVNEAIERLKTVVDKDNIFIVTAEIQTASIQAVTSGKINKNNILSEPAARNTAACIGYAATEIMKKYDDGIMIVTPADHYIKKVYELTDIFKKAINIAEKEDKLITIGIKPTFPSTGFGYIRFETEMTNDVKQVIQFHEKPDEATAKSYLETGQYLWNSGMFIWKASVILEKFKEYIPDIYSNLVEIGDAMGTHEEEKVITEIYPQIRKISIDYGVMEPSAEKGDVLVISGECGWNDVGSWDMMDILHESDSSGNVLLGDVVVIDTRDTIVYSTSRTVTAVDVDNIIIVETPDAVMVCPKDKAQNVKKIVDALKEAGRTDLL